MLAFRAVVKINNRILVTLLCFYNINNLIHIFFRNMLSLFVVHAQGVAAGLSLAGLAGGPAQPKLAKRGVSPFGSFGFKRVLVVAVYFTMRT